MTENSDYVLAPPLPGPEDPAAPGRRALLRSPRVPWLLLALVSVFCVGFAAVAGWLWLREPDAVDTSLHVAAGTVQADLLSPDEVSALAGTTFVAGARAGEPAAALGAEPSTCAAAVGPATKAVYGQGWTTFVSATYGDAAGAGDYTATQVIGIYPEAGAAGAALRVLADGLRNCPAAQRAEADGRNSTWTYKTDTVAPETVVWTAVQDAGDGWACYRQARATGRALVQVALCEAGDGSSAVSKIADRLAAKVTQ
ncbi:sensor domain-containing protein [Kitasatospora sp. NPDC058170]|uniref:sensor domain-containing protein n=1 Tax=Kitasatospora sp. NPDC058170 TaxID=3346364 RepID=UPI0036DB486F